jgi:hypothetical protein
MRAMLTVALRRESEEFERETVDRLVEQAYEQVRESLMEVSEEIQDRLGNEGIRLMRQLEEGYIRAIEIAARNGLGCQVVPRENILRDPRARIPLAAIQPPAEPVAPAPAAGPDQVISVRPCS